MRRWGWVALAFFAVGAGAPYALSQDLTYKDEAGEAAAFNVTRTTKTVAGLNFRVEEDRPIEKVAGVYRPIDIDSYVAFKINKLQRQMQELIAALAGRVATLEADVAALK